MPGCSAIGCKNRSEYGYRMFLLPQGERNEARRRQWIINIGRADLPSRSVICEVHFTNDQFENNRLDKRKLLKWNSVPTEFDVNAENAGIRRSQRKRTLIKEENLEWPPPVHLSKRDVNSSSSNVKTKRRRTRDLEEASETNDKAVRCVKVRKELLHAVKNEPDDDNDNDEEEEDVVLEKVVKKRFKSRKLFDEEGFLMDCALKKKSTVLVSRLENKETNSVSNLKDCEASNANSLMMTPNSSVSVSTSETADNLIEDHSIDSSSLHEAVTPPNHISDCSCSDNRLNDGGDNSKSINNTTTLHNITYKGFNLVTSSTSKLEDFAEIISEEHSPKTRISILGHKKKSAVKRVVRVSTENICRICGKLSDSLIPIYSDGGKRRRVPFYIDQYLPIKVSETDATWPSNICELCIKCLTEWNGLFSKCRQVDAMFGKLLNRPPLQVLSTTVASDQIKDQSSKDDEQCSVLKIQTSNNSHNHCPGENDRKTAVKETTPNNHQSDDSRLSDAGCDEACCTSTSSKRSDNDSAIEDEINKSSKPSCSLDCNTEPSQIVNRKGNSGNEILSDSNGVANKTDLGKQQYKIGITLVKNKDCNEGGELDFVSLKSILISKVNQLFQSICNDSTIGKSLVNKSSLSGNGCDTDADNFEHDNTNGEVSNDIDGNSVDESQNMKLNVTKTSRKNNASRSNRLPKNRKAPVLDDSGSYLCSDCGIMMTERKSFLTHRRMYHVERKCHYCNNILSSLHEYRKHLRALHLDKISNCCCEICGATFIRRERLQRHKLIIHNIGEYVYCNICNKKCASRQQLYCHKSDAHNKIKNLCHHCGQNFASHQSFLAHLKKKHSYRKHLSCSSCNKSFNSRSNLDVHMEKCQIENSMNEEALSVKISPKVTSANSKLYTCLICSVKITDVEMLKLHMNYHANDEYIKNLVGQDTKSDYECILCGIYLSTEKDLALHRFYSHQEAPFICRVVDCNITFWKRMSLIMHQMTVHKMPSNTCKICSESFSDFKEKRRHMKTHHPNSQTQDKPYVCNICNRRFCWKSTLKTHMVIHSDVKLYKCHVCGKEFKLKLTLSKHMHYHLRTTNKSYTQNSEEEMQTCEVTETTEVTDETETKQLYPFESGDEVAMVNSAGLLKICAVFKCPDCNILFTHKETRDSHFLEEHADKQQVILEDANKQQVILEDANKQQVILEELANKQQVKYEIGDVINESEFV